MMITCKAALLLLASTAASLLQGVQGQSCDFTVNLGSGGLLSTEGEPTFQANQNARTTCTFTCGTPTAGLFLYLRYGGSANAIFNDGSGSSLTGCGITVDISSGGFETTLGYQVIATAYTDLQLRCSCTSAATDPGCFSADTMVDVLGHDEPVRMDALQVGDMVKTTSGYQKLYSFGHREETEEMEFVQIYTDPKEEPLELSLQHMVFVDETFYLGGFWPQTKAVRADTIKAGDVLLLESSDKVVVTKVTTAIKEGAYMPLTPDGTIIANGIQASAYVSIAKDGASKVLDNFDYYKFSEQNLSHWWMSPYRMLCMGVSSKFCSTNPKMMWEGDDENHGILKWLLAGREYARFADDLSFLVHHFFGIPTFFLFGFCLLMETIFGAAYAPTAVFALATFGTWYVARRQTTRKQA